MIRIWDRHLSITLFRQSATFIHFQLFYPLFFQKDCSIPEMYSFRLSLVKVYGFIQFYQFEITHPYQIRPGG